MTQTGSLILALASMQDGTPPPWIQLLPIGMAKPRDARAAWQVKDPQAIALASAKNLPMLIDVDHIADAQPQGTRNPAYGWIEEIAATGPNGEDGVWGRVDWTGLGAKALAAKEYRYISPVFFHDVARDVRSIVRATLTNDPALTLKALASRQANDPENPMSLAAIAAALSLAATSTEAEIIAAIGQRDTAAQALASRLRDVATAAGLAEGQAVDDNAVLAIASKLKAAPAKPGEGFVPQADFDRLQLQLASVQTSIAAGAAGTEVDAAIRAGRLVPAQRDWAVGYASREPDAFKAFVAAQPVILSDGRVATAAPGEGQLTAEQKALCSNLGITEEAFKKEMAATTKGTA